MDIYLLRAKTRQARALLKNAEKVHRKILRARTLQQRRISEHILNNLLCRAAEIFSDEPEPGPTA